MLTGYLALICMIVAVIYTILDLSNGAYYALVAYGFLFLIPLVSLYLIRSRKYRAAKIGLVASINLVVFWSAITDPFETGVFLFFIPAGIGAFAILAFDDRRTGLVMTGFTIALFLLAYFGDIRLVDVSRPSEL